jgi:carbonic anhydrase
MKARLPATAALERLLDGNRRFAAGLRTAEGLANLARRAALVSGQEPFAIILGCSDSRVPAEIVFDQGLGDLFVIRVAGNIVAPSQIGSVEFAAEQFGARLVVVLGHSRCGAVRATLDELRRPGETRSRNLRSIVDRIRPSVEGLLATRALGADELEREAMRANVRAAGEQLRHGSEVIERLVDTDGLLVVCADYSLDTGLVELLDAGGGQPVTVRPATPADTEAWVRLRAALWPDAVADEHWLEAARFFAPATSPMCAFVAEDGSGLLGFAEVSVRGYAEGCRADRIGFLEGWFVVPEARRRGIGRRLVTAAEHWARAQGCPEFASDAEAANAQSATAHRALGFEDAGLVRCFRKNL